MPRRVVFPAAVLASAAALYLPSPSRAADPPAGGAPLHGADVMDGKDKPGQDGWSWAPVPKTQAAGKSGQTPGEGKTTERANDGSRPVPDTGKHLSPGQDPGTPLRPTAVGPGGTGAAHPGAGGR